MKLDVFRIVNYCFTVNADARAFKTGSMDGMSVGIQAMQAVGYICVSGKDHYIMGLRIIMLQLEVKLADECQKNRPCHR